MAKRRNKSERRKKRVSAGTRGKRMRRANAARRAYRGGGLELAILAPLMAMADLSKGRR